MRHCYVTIGYQTKAALIPNGTTGITGSYLTDENTSGLCETRYCGFYNLIAPSRWFRI